MTNQTKIQFTRDALRYARKKEAEAREARVKCEIELDKLLREFDHNKEKQ